MARSRAGTAAAPDFDALKHFAGLTDREASPFFGGRTDEMATVERALKRIHEKALEDHLCPAAGETMLFSRRAGRGQERIAVPPRKGVAQFRAERACGGQHCTNSLCGRAKASTPYCRSSRPCDCRKFSTFRNDPFQFAH